MAKYSVELRHVIESGRNIFPFQYDFYDEKKRPKFEQDFIRHFYFHEIGAPTIDAFILFLEDKMNTVFPFYNTLLKTAQTEYSYLENYDMKEETVITRDTEGKVHGVSSMVGQAFDKQNTINDENRTTDTTGKDTENGSSENSKTTHSETDTTGKETVDSDGTSHEETEGTSHEENKGTNNNVQNSKKKFLDTPQGLTDLTESRYLTNLTEDDSNTNGSTSEEKDGSTTGKKDGSTTEDRVTDSEGHSETNGTESGNGKTVLTRDSEGKETVKGMTESTFEGEQKTTADNNTRSETIGKETVKTEHFRHGNIGVQTATDMIEKHIELQKKLSRILEMFFEECNDLFMLVY